MRPRRGLRVGSIIIAMAVWLGVPPPAGSGAQPLQPQLIVSDLEEGGRMVADAVVTDYGAVPDDQEDDTGAFSGAIADVRAAGGGTVFVPRGRYVFHGNLAIPPGVVVRGEWVSPARHASCRGTILCVYTGRDSSEEAAFITLSPSSGIRNLSIWYPEQDYAGVRPFPWSIAGAGMHNTVLNVTLVNSYRGIRIGPEWNELHYIRNVFGTPLEQGLFVDTCSDVGRISGLHFSPRYWQESGLPGAPATPEAAGTLKSRLSAKARGLVIARSDWEYVYDVTVSDYAVGVQVTLGHGPAPNGQLFGVSVEGARTALQVDQTLAAGFLVTGSSFRASVGPDPVAVRIGPLFSGVLAFNDCRFGGAPSAGLRNEGGGMVTCQNSVFEDWGHAGGGYAIEAQAGMLSAQGCRFVRDAPQVSLGLAVSNASLLGNVVGGGLRVERGVNQRITIDETPRRFPSVDATVFPMPEDMPEDPSPALSPRLIVARDPAYGAEGDGRTDDTAAIQRALDAAGQGGGIVYLPAGQYRVDGRLIVPTGVELRGCWDLPHHTQVRGTVLRACGGRGEPDGDPLISLSPGSGVHGLTVLHPDQDHRDIRPYPWVIQARGKGCWVRYVTLCNAYRGVDFATFRSDGHWIEYLAGCPLATGLAVGRSAGGGWVRDVHFNPHYWARSGYPNAATDWQRVWGFQKENLDAFLFGDCIDENVLGVFAFGFRNGLRFVKQDAGGFRGKLIGAGSDGGTYGLVVDQAEDISLVNTEIVCLQAQKPVSIVTQPTFAGRLRLFNTSIWGTGKGGSFAGTGEVCMQQLNLQGDQVQVTGGSFTGNNLFFQSSSEDYVIVGPDVAGVELLGCSSLSEFMVRNWAAGGKLTSCGHISEY